VDSNHAPGAARDRLRTLLTTHSSGRSKCRPDCGRVKVADPVVIDERENPFSYIAASCHAPDGSLKLLDSRRLETALRMCPSTDPREAPRWADFCLTFGLSA